MSGDIENFDKGVLDLFLYYYVYELRRYYAVDQMSEVERRIFERMLRDLAYHTVNKVVLTLDNLWKLISGVVWSGGFDTSHVDSWIMCIYFWLFTEWIKMRNPRMEKLIDELITRGFIAIAVYGDDHIWVAPTIVRKIMNAKLWAEFLHDFCRTILRDYKEFEDFVSEANFVTGGLKTRGPKFLKMHFIESTKEDRKNGLPWLIPFRECTEPLLKAFCATDYSPENVAIGICGQMYCSFGTNPVTYEILSRYLETAVPNVNDLDFVALYKKAQQDPENALRLSSLAKKLNLNPAKVYAAIPSYESMRMMHKYDPARCIYGKKNWYTRPLNMVDYE